MKEFLQKEQSRILILIHRLTNIIYFFISSFLMIYFLKVTNWNLQILSMHYILKYIALTVGFFLLGSIMSRKNILIMFKTGIVSMVAYLIIILALKENVRDYIMLLGVVKGVGDALYWIPRHYMVFKLNKSKTAKKFFSIDQAIGKIQDIVMPLLMGSLIGATTEGYGMLMVVLVAILVVAFVVSNWLDMSNVEVQSLKRENFKKLFKSNHIDKIKKMYLSEFFNGIAAGGVLVQVINMLIYLVYGSEFGLGMFKSVLALVIAIIMFYIGHYLKDEKFESALKISGVLTVGVLAALIFKINQITLIAYSVVTGISFVVIQIIGNSNMVKLSREEEVKHFTLENIVLRELSMNIGRVLGYLVLFNVGSIENNAGGLKAVLLFLTVCISLRIFEVMLALQERDEHTLHAVHTFKFNLRTLKFILKK